MKGDKLMDTNKKDSDNSPASNAVSPDSVLTPPTQPMPKSKTQPSTGTKTSPKPVDTKDSDPTQ